MSNSRNTTGIAKHEYPIIVHCHLRWEGVWQRPQQFLSRLSARHHVLFVEGPLLQEGDFEPFLTLKPVPGYPNITVMHTTFPADRFSDGAWVDRERRSLLAQAIHRFGDAFKHPVQWFYDPMAVTAHAGYFQERAIVYDCMDELSQFRFAPPEIITRERELLAKADVVFTGGRKMWLSKSRFNTNCHFYGCGVDVTHFGKARLEETIPPPDIQPLKRPVLGYFGVVDERLDYELLAQLASASDWSLAIIGPTCKVNPAELPQAPNLHWLGRREYNDLPAYTKAFDLCLMPFALNEATEYINPTKALEYMAAGRLIVSSAVPDVVFNFSRVVKIANSHQEFIHLCRQMVQHPDQDAIDRGLAMAQENQWETIISRLEGHIEDALDKKSSGVRTARTEMAALTAA